MLKERIKLLGDIIIDDEARDDYSKDFQEDRIKRANSFIYQLEGELDLVNSIIDFKKKEKEERLSEEQIREEKIIDDTEELNDVEDMTQNIENLRNDIKKEENINEIINIVEKHPEVLNSLPLSKLEKLDLMYDEKICKNQRDISELIRKIESINEKCIKLGMQ